MTSSEKTLVSGFLQKTLKLDKGDVDALFNEEGELTTLEPVINADKTRVDKFKEESKSQYARGLREKGESFEKPLKSKYGIEEDLQGVELVEFIVSQETAKIASVDTGDIEKHPKYPALKMELEKQLKEKQKEFDSQVEKIQREREREKVTDKVKDEAIKTLRSLNPIIPQGKEQTWESTYLDKLLGVDWRESNGKIIAYKDDKPMQDDHGNQIYLDGLSKKVAESMFEFKVADPREATGNQNTPNNGSLIPKTKEEYVEMMKKADTPQKQAELTKAFTESQKN